jgi:hypothetical protein
VKQLNGALQDKAQAMERLEAELKAAWGRALEAEGDRLVLMERVSAEGREMSAVGEGLWALEQGCGGLEEALRAVAGGCDQVGLHAARDCGCGFQLMGCAWECDVFLVVGQVARVVVSARAELAERTEERDGIRTELEAATVGLASAHGTVRDQEEAVGRLESEARGLLARAEAAERQQAELAERLCAQEAGDGAVWAGLLEMTGSLERGCCGLEGAMRAVGTEWEQVWGSGCVLLCCRGGV